MILKDATRCSQRDYCYPEIRRLSSTFTLLLCLFSDKKSLNGGSEIQECSLIKQSDASDQGEVHKISFAKCLKLCVLYSELLHYNEMAEVHSAIGLIQCKMKLVICIVVSLKNE